MKEKKMNRLDLFYYYDEYPRSNELVHDDWYGGASFKYTDRPIKFIRIDTSNKSIVLNLETMKIKKVR
jgi:hypothetical protein